MSRTTVKLHGFKELDRALEEFKPATAKAISRRALLKAAEPIVADARRLVPVRFGHLRDGIHASTARGHDVGKAAYAATLRAGGTKGDAVAALRSARRGSTANSAVEIAVGPGRNPHAHLQEFGTVHHGPQPFLRPAWDANKRKALDIIKDAMGDEIGKAATRAARKAAKAAKSGG